MLSEEWARWLADKLNVLRMLLSDVLVVIDERIVKSQMEQVKKRSTLPGATTREQTVEKNKSYNNNLSWRTEAENMKKVIDEYLEIGQLGEPQNFHYYIHAWTYSHLALRSCALLTEGQYDYTSNSKRVAV